MKPDNIYRTAEGVLKVGDFGLAVLKNPNRASGFQWVSQCSLPCTDVGSDLLPYLYGRVCSTAWAFQQPRSHIKGIQDSPWFQKVTRLTPAGLGGG